MKAQTYLENNYPSHIREHLKWINLTNSNLEGELDFKEFTNLETLWCSYNSLTKLNSLEKTKLKSLRCCNNQITNLDFNFLLELEDIDCDNNLLEYSNLDITRIKMVNLLKQKLLLESKKKNIKLKNNSAQKEIQIIQPEPDEKQAELEIEFGNLPEDQEEQQALKRLQALEATYNKVNTHKLATKQARRQFQILVPPKK